MNVTLRVRPYRTRDTGGGQRTVAFCTHLPGGQNGMAEKFTEKLIENVRKYVFLHDTGHPEYKNVVK